MTAPLAVPADVAGSETAAAIENTLITAYGQLSSLPFVDELGLGAFLAATVQHHTDHLAAFNAAAVRLGGKAQSLPDQPLMTTVVEPGLAKLASGFDAVMFSAGLELISAATCTAQVATVADAQLRAVLASVAGVESQHQGVLLIVASLLSSSTAVVDGLPVPPRQLPPTLEGPPLAFVRSDQARPLTEGAVR